MLMSYGMKNHQVQRTIFVLMLFVGMCLLGIIQWMPLNTEALSGATAQQPSINLTNFARLSSTQCGRTYSDSIPFSSSISVGSCPSLPHVSLAAGHRVPSNKYPGVWHVNNCVFKWFLPNEACDLVGSVGKIHFHGDSLIRQLTVGLGVVLSGNYRSGGLARSTPPAYLEACQCERQWQCWKHPANHRFERGEYKSPQFDLCPNWTRDHILNFPIEDYKASHGPLVVVSNAHAMHSLSNFDVPKKKMDELLKKARETNGTLIPMTLHYPGENKQEAYRTSQGPSQIEVVNGKMLSWAQENKLWPLRLFEYTNGIWSRDGVHYDDENIVFAQLLLNSLWRMQREHNVIAVVSERDPGDPTSYKFGKPQDVGIPAYTGKIPRPFSSFS